MKRASTIDAIVAQRIKTIRLERQYTQQHVAEKLKITYQQLQKYESGKDRISAGRLYQFSVIFHVPIQDFFETL